MNKFVVNKFGLVTLTIVFILLYGYMNAFNNSESVINVGDQNEAEEQHNLVDESSIDAHFLVDVQFTEKDDYYRISIPIKTNSSFAGDLAVTPQTDIQQLALSNVPEVYRPWIDVEAYCIKISIADSAPAQINDIGMVKALLNTKNIQVRNDLITDIDLISVEESTSDILIGLNKEVEFSINQNETGIIIIDILK